MLVKIKRLTVPDFAYDGSIYPKCVNDNMIKRVKYLLKNNKLYLTNQNTLNTNIYEYMIVKPDTIIGTVKEIHNSFILVDIRDGSEYIDIIQNNDVRASIRGIQKSKTYYKDNINNYKHIISDIKLICFDLVIKSNERKYKTITLCGSTKFKEEFYRAHEKLTNEGYIVLMPGIFSKHDNVKLTEDKIKMFHDMHMKRIDMSDAIYVINKDGYIGKATLEEIEYAKSNNKEILYLENQ